MNDEKRGKFLQQLRIEKNLTQKEVSEILHYSDNAISNWEKGKTLPNNPETLVKISELYEVSIEELLYGERKSKDNSKEISNNMENVYKKSYKKFKTTLTITIILSLVLVVVSLISIYFIYIKGKIISYKIEGASEHFIIDNSSILYTNKVDILNLNKVTPRNNEIINKITFYYVDEKGKKRLIFSGPNNFYYVEEDKGYNEYNFKELINNKSFIEINYNDNLKEVISLNLIQRFKNDSIFVKEKAKISDEDVDDIISKDEELHDFLIKEGFKETADGYEKIYKNKKYIYSLGTKTIYLFKLDDKSPEQIMISIDINFLSYTGFNEKKGDIISEDFLLSEESYKKTDIKFINDNIEYLLYLKDKN